MHNDSVQAYLRLLSTRKRRPSLWWEQRVEEALEIILRQPNRTGDPRYLARNALKDARTKLSEREEVMSRRSADIDVMAEGGAGRFRVGGEVAEDRASDASADAAPGYEELLIDVVDMIRRGLRGGDAALLALAMMGGVDTSEIAVDFGITEEAARQRLHRARVRAREAWTTLH